MLWVKLVEGPFKWVGEAIRSIWTSDVGSFRGTGMWRETGVCGPFASRLLCTHNALLT